MCQLHDGLDALWLVYPSAAGAAQPCLVLSFVAGDP
jgi:hypothetical protein